MISFPHLIERRGIIAAVYILLAAFIFLMWIWSAETPITSFNGDPRSTLSGIIYGTAHKPYVQRVLIPILTRAIHSSLPETSWTVIETKILSSPKIQKETSRLGWEIEFLSEYMIALSLAFLALATFPFAIRKLWNTIYSTGEAVSNAVPVVMLLFLPVVFPTGPHYIYDFPALLLFTTGFFLLLNRRWLWYYPVFAIGCINKETMVLLAVAYVLIFVKVEPTRRMATHLVAQFFTYAVIKITLASMFAANGGTSLEFHLFSNFHTILLGYTWSSAMVALVTAWLLFHDFEQKAKILRQGVILVGAFGLLLFCFGTITELRDLYEVLPIVLFLMLHTFFFSYLKLPFTPKTVMK